MKKIISTQNAPKAIGPYSQAVMAGDFLFVSGQLPIDPLTGDFAGTDITSQTRQSLINLSEILKEAGMNLNDVVKTTVFLSDIKNFKEMNDVYCSFFTSDYPARSAVQVAKIPKDALVEIEAICFKK